MKRAWFVFLLVTALLFLTIPSSGQQGSAESKEVRVIAHYKEKTDERIFATGHVEVHYKDIKLLADRIDLNTETKDILAEGNISIHFPDEVISCERIHFNLDSSKGELEKVFGRIQPSIFYEADSIKRKDVNFYNLKKAKITSCTQSVPRWKFSCASANFKKDDYIEMWHSVLSIKKIPLFYLPYMRYPLDRERATGFLMPQLGYSHIKGLFFSQSFYLALKRNMDATFNVDYYSARGTGGGVEYRYMFSGGTGGDLRAFFFKFKKTPEQQNLDDAYIFRFNHNQPLPLNLSLIANIDYQSSFDFLREFDNNFKRAVVSNRSSVVYLTRAWSFYNFNARISRFETFFAESDTAVIKKNLPSISFSSSQIKLFSPLHFSFSSVFDRWEYGWDFQYEKGQQTRSKSITFKPALNMPFNAIPWVSLNSTLLANLNYYFQSREPERRAIVDEPLLSTNYAVNLDLVGPVLYRVFFDGEGTPKLKHIIEPTVSYRYESPISAADQIITASGYFFRLHQLSYGLTNRFLIKKNEMPREVLTLGVSQVFYLAPEESPLSQFKQFFEGETPSFSDITGYLRFYPSQKYSIDFSTAYNPYKKKIPRLRLGLNLGNINDRVFCQISWFKSVNPYYEERLYNRHQVSFFGGVKIPEISLEAQAAFDWNIQEREMLYTLFSVVYHYQCLDFKADLKIFYFREKPETQFRVSFGLGNIGKTTDLLGGH